MEALRRYGVQVSLIFKCYLNFCSFYYAQVEYEETYCLVILPEFATIPLPNTLIPQNVRAHYTPDLTPSPHTLHSPCLV